MRTLDVNVPRSCDKAEAPRIVELLCSREGLNKKMRRSLEGKPGSIHWHYKKGAETGTLEVTFLPDDSKILFSIHENRKGPWTERSVTKLVRAIEVALKSGKKNLGIS